MNRWLLSGLTLFTIASFAQEASAQVVVFGPSITFSQAPRLVVVSPGVRVVQDYDREVFFVGGYYWTRADGRWFRARHHRARWLVVEQTRVPRVIVKIKPGRYRHFKGHASHAKRGHGRGKHKHRHRS